MVELDFGLFDDREFTFRVIDRPDSSTPRLAGAMNKHSLLGVNGGYFGKAFEPLGWLVVDGREINPRSKAKLLSGVLVVGKRTRLLRLHEISNGSGVQQALQAGPFLVDKGETVDGLESNRRAARTFVGTDGKGRWILGVAFSPTLAEAGELLATDGLIDDFKPDRILNLDGGRSTGFWARQPDGAAPLHYPEISDVRNFLTIEAKDER